MLTLNRRLPFESQAKYWSTNSREIEGTVFDKSGKAVHRLWGKWHESIYHGGPSSSTCVWRASQYPGNQPGAGGDGGGGLWPQELRGGWQGPWSLPTASDCV